MAVIVRFVNKKGKVVERFLGLEYLTEDTPAAVFKETLVRLLAQHGLSISRPRGQGYDGASKMRREFNDMQLLIRDENPYAFYVHCFAHQLESVLVTLSRCSSSFIHEFFDDISLIVTTTIESCQTMDASTEKHHQITKSLLLMRRSVEFTACYDIASLAAKMVETDTHSFFHWYIASSGWHCSYQLQKHRLKKCFQQ